MNEGVEKTAEITPVVTQIKAVAEYSKPARMTVRELLDDPHTTFVPADRLDSLKVAVTHAHVIIVFSQNSEWFFLRYCSPTASPASDEGNVPGGKIEQASDPDQALATTETPEGAATRECLEETGLALQLDQLQTIGVIENMRTGLVDQLFFVALPDDAHSPIPRESPEGGIITLQPVSQLLAELDENSPMGLQEAIRAKLRSHEIPIDSLQQ